MPFHLKILTVILLLLVGMLLGALLMLFRTAQETDSRVEVRYTDVIRSTGTMPPEPPELHYSPAYNFRGIAESIIPAVVYIETELAASASFQEESYQDFEGRFWERFMPRRHAQSIGSGVLITTDGYILTNHHVIDGAEGQIRVILHDNREYVARVIGRDPSTDLAVIKIDITEAPHMIIGNSDLLEIGDWVMAVGNPFRLRSTVTAGIVSAKGRDVEIINERMRIESFIQTDAAINRGNSGGALVNIRGELVGINTAIASESGNYQGYGFAVPINLAMKIGQDMIEYGSVRRAYLGVEITTVSHRRAEALGLERVSGVEIRNLIPGGSADLGGVKKGDIILRVNGHQVQQANQLQERIAMMMPGEPVHIKLWRNRDVVELEFPVLGYENQTIRQWAAGQIPSEHEILPADRNMDMEFDPDLESIIEQRDLPAGFSVAELASSQDLSRTELVVIQVKENSRAWRAGIRSEDVIASINGEDVKSLNEFSRVWDRSSRHNETARLELYRQGERIRITVQTP